jgi:hypothetical protein
VLFAALVAAPARAADQGIQVVSSQQLDSRLTELTLSTPALKKPTHVRVLVPDGYEAGQDRYLAARAVRSAAIDRPGRSSRSSQPADE